jgi:hypothetical protein
LRGFDEVEARTMMHARNFAVAVVAIGVVVFAVGSMEASAQTSPGTPSSAVVQQPPSGSAAPSIPQYQIVTQTPGTGSVVIVQQPSTGGSGPSVPQYQLVIPGPNPAQNTGVSLGEQLSTTRESPVTVYTVPTV